MPVDDNQRVRAGQVLAQIDPRLYQAALDQARANVAAAQASIATLEQQIEQQRLVVEQDRQQVVADQSAQTYTQQNFVRYTTLARDSWGTVKNAQQATADVQEKMAALQRDTIGVASAQKQIEVVKAQLAQAKATFAIGFATAVLSHQFREARWSVPGRARTSSKSQIFWSMTRPAITQLSDRWSRLVDFVAC